MDSVIPSQLNDKYDLIVMEEVAHFHTDVIGKIINNKDKLILISQDFTEQALLTMGITDHFSIMFNENGFMVEQYDFTEDNIFENRTIYLD